MLLLYFPSLLLNFRHYCGKTYTKFIVVIIPCPLQKTRAEPQEQRRETSLFEEHTLFSPDPGLEPTQAPG